MPVNLPCRSMIGLTDFIYGQQGVFLCERAGKLPFLQIVTVVCNFQITHKSEVVDSGLDRAFVDKNIYLC